MRPCYRVFEMPPSSRARWWHFRFVLVPRLHSQASDEKMATETQE